jgi:hypothetical protein
MTHDDEIGIHLSGVDPRGSGRTKRAVFDTLSRVFTGEHIIYVAMNMVESDYVMRMVMDHYQAQGALLIKGRDNKPKRPFEIQWGAGKMFISQTAADAERLTAGTLRRVVFDHAWTSGFPRYNDVRMWQETAKRQDSRMESGNG